MVPAVACTSDNTVSMSACAAAHHAVLVIMHAGLRTSRSLVSCQAPTQPHAPDKHDALRGCRKEESIPEDPTQAPVEQDIIRLPGLGVILTRFKCYGRPLSMLVRIRPGWEELARYLRTGLTEPGYALCAINWACMTVAHNPVAIQLFQKRRMPPPSVRAI